MKTIISKLKKLMYGRDGHFAVWFALMAFPLLAATSLVIDYRSTEANAAGIKTALDTAVLAAVSNDSLDNPAKEALAKEVFNFHYMGKADLTLSPKATDGRVEMTASGTLGTSVGRAVGYNQYNISETSIAEMNRENTICVLALANSGKDKLRFLGGTDFNSPTCSVQSNSQDVEGVYSNSRYTPRAKSFCSAGGALGRFDPAIRGQCRVIDDPYVSRPAPAPGTCKPASIFRTSTLTLPVTQVLSAANLNGHENPASIIPKNNGKHQHYHCHPVTGACNNGAHDAGELHAPLPGLRLDNLGVSLAEQIRLKQDYDLNKIMITESINYTIAGGVYHPGTYCGGLTVDGKNVTFMPGVYIIKDGPLTFKNGASASAQDVSFVMHGADAVLTVESGSYVNVKAPRSGPMAGLAFFQDQHVKATGLQKAMVPPTGVNLLSSGGELNVTGTMYFPTQALEVVGDSVLGAQAPATSFIAYQVTFAGETKAEVSVDHVAGDIPPMLPRSDDGARLVK